MTAEAGAGWRFLPKEGTATEGLDTALRDGPAAYARALRQYRTSIGASRTAARLRATGVPSFATSLRVLVAAPIQPQSLLDALTVGLSLVGFDADIELVDGFAALSRRVTEQGEADLVLVVDASPSEEADPALVSLARDCAEGLGAPVALARFGSALSQACLAPGVDLLTVGTPPEAAVDQRFSASFGTILRPKAADELADAAGAWAARLKGRAPKLVVTDLDGTLWDGVLGEPAAASAEALPPLNLAYATALKTLSSRGFVLAVASRNDAADVDAAFEATAIHPLRRADVAAFAVGWADKAELVSRVLAEVGLGAEHTVFIDDDPVNCAKVAARYPEMDVRLFGLEASTFAASLLADPLLLGGGAEAGLRAERYLAKAGVDRLRAEAGDTTAFLAALRTRLTFQPLDGPNLARAAELASRVNQFVFREMRPGAAELSRRHSPFDILVRLDDAFGAHGIVGLMLARREGDALVLDNLYLSCRALERGVEEAMLSALAERAEAFGLGRIVGRADITARNAPARAFLAGIARLAADGSFDYPIGGAHARARGAPEIVWQDEKGEAP